MTSSYNSILPTLIFLFHFWQTILFEMYFCHHGKFIPIFKKEKENILQIENILHFLVIINNNWQNPEPSLSNTLQGASTKLLTNASPWYNAKHLLLKMAKHEDNYIFSAPSMDKT